MERYNDPSIVRGWKGVLIYTSWKADGILLPVHFLGTYDYGGTQRETDGGSKARTRKQRGGLRNRIIAKKLVFKETAQKSSTL